MKQILYTAPTLHAIFTSSATSFRGFYHSFCYRYQISKCLSSFLAKSKKTFSYIILFINLLDTGQRSRGDLMISCQFLYKLNLLWLPGQVLIGKKFLPVILYMTKDICFHQKLVVVLSYNKIHTSFSNFYEIQRAVASQVLRVIVQALQFHVKGPFLLIRVKTKILSRTFWRYMDRYHILEKKFWE